MKYLKILLSILITFSCLNINISNSEAEETTNYGYIDEDYEAPSRSSSSTSSSRAGTSYDSEYSSETTSVKNQGQWGTCWAFSYVAMAETYLLNNEDVETDLSERQLAYFMYNSVTDPLGNTEGDGIEITASDETYLTLGGNAMNASLLLSGYCGLVDEEDAEYSPYADMDNLDDEYAYNYNSYVLDTVYFMADDSTEEEIKEQIMTNGAVIASFYSSNSYYDSSTGAYYNYESTSTNHAILIVGWDDDYDFSDSSLSTLPSSNGAWKVKNSWGTSSGDDGYLWISYEDTSLQNFYSATFTSADDYDYNYHYDGTGGSYSLKISDGYYAANVYEVKGNSDGNEELDAVSFALNSTDVEYSIQIYTDLSDTSDPLSGTVALSTPVTGTTTYAGIYTVDIDEEVILESGTNYSVVITVNSTDGTGKTSLFIEMEYSSSSYEYNSNTEQNQSFYGTVYGTGSKSYDMSSNYDACFRIKAMTNDTDKEVKNIKNATITGVEDSYDYTGSAITPELTLTYDGETLTEDVDYTLEYSDNTSAGTASILITGIGDYYSTVTKTFTINGKSIENATVTLSPTSYTYSGSANKPTPTVVLDGETLIKSTDYMVTYSDNTNAGTATCIVTGTGNYTGTASATFTINAKSISSATITLSDSTFTYDGTNKEPTVTVTLSSKTLSEDTDYTVSYDDNINAGTVTITITGIGNYTDTKTKTFTIDAKSIEDAEISLSQDSYTYSGKENTPVPTVTIDGTTLTQDTDYTVTYSDNTNAGTATVTVTGIGNYTGSVSSTFTISAISLEDASVTAGESFTYTGSAITPDITVTLDDTELTLNTDYTVTYSDNTDVGTATLTITGTGNYTGTITKTFTIAAQEVTDDEVITLSAETFGYTGSAITPEIEIVIDGITLVEDTDYTVAYSDNTEVGTATITVTFMGNYSGTVTKTFTIVDIRELSSDHVTITFDDTDLTYTGSSIKPGVTVKYDGTVLAEDEDYTLSYSSDTVNVGTVTVTIEGMNAYDGTMTATYTISAKSISGATVKLKTTSFTYNGSSQSTSVSSVTLDGTTLSSSYYSVSGTSGTSAGTYTVTVTGKGNYTGTATATFTISKYTLTSSNISYTSSYTYKASAISPTITVKANSKTLTKGTDYTLSGTTSATSAGTYTFKITGSGNFTGTVSKTFTIKQAAVSSTTITLGYTSTTYTGSALKPSVTVKIGSTTISSSNYSVSYSDNTNKGTATVTIKGKNNLSGSDTRNFTISAKSISSATVTLSSTSYTYNGSAKKPAVTVKYNGKTLTSGTDYTVSYSSNANAGTAKVTITGKGNFTSTTTKSFIINKCSISSATASSISNKAYTGSKIKPTFTLTYNGKTLTKGTDYTVSYSNNKSTGKATITITGTGTNFKGTKKVYFYIVPKKVTISSVKSSKTKTLTVKYKKATGASGYQIAYKKSGGSWKYKTVSSGSTLSKTITGLTKKKSYTVKVRAYKTVSGKKHYGSWSKTKTVKTK